MAFFNAPAIKKVNLQKLQSYIPTAQHGVFDSPDGYQCEIIFNQSLKMILMIGTHADGHIMIRSEFRPLELSILLKNAPHEMLQTIKDALKNNLPDYSPLSEAWMTSNDDGEAFPISKDILAHVPFLKTPQRGEFSKETAFNILQAEYGITKHDADRPILASTGAGPCVILSLYNEQEKLGFLSHIDDATDLNEISSCIFEMRTNTDQPLTAHMIGGWSDTYNMVANIALRLEEQPNINLAGWEDAGNITSNFALDTRNGHVYSAFNVESLDSGPMLKERNNRILGSFNGGFRPPLLSYHHLQGRNTAESYAR